MSISKKLHLKDLLTILIFFNEFLWGAHAIYQHFQKEASKVLGVIEVDTPEYIAICLTLLVVLLVIHKEWFKRQIDELTGKAKREQERQTITDLKAKKEKQRAESVGFLKKALEVLSQHSSLRIREYHLAKSMEILKSFGFIRPSEYERNHSDSDYKTALQIFLARAISLIELEKEKDHPNLWKEALSASYWVKQN